MPDTTTSLHALKRQLQQLNELAQTGTLGEAAAAEARAELERRIVAAVLADETPPAPAAPPAVSRPSRGLVLICTAFVAVFGLAGYAWLGSSDGLGAGPGPMATAPQGGASAPHAMTSVQIEGMVASLARRLKDQPDDADGWLMLGRSYAVLGRHDEAVPAYRKVLALRVQDAQAMADLADALAMQNQRSFAGEPARLLKSALAADPDNLKALSLAGTLAFKAKDYAGAVQHWDRAVRVGPADSDLVRQARDNAAQARSLGGLPAAASAATAAASAAAAAVVSGVVELAPAVAAGAAADDTVFVFARPAQGGGMPLALLRKRVRDLPLRFTLDDTLAMSPQARLSSAAQVVVGARVSKSGQAMAQPGDLQGFSSPVALGQRDLRIVIGEVVR